MQQSTSLPDELKWFYRQARAPRLRTMRQFAESEIVIPDGPYAGRRFRCSRQPYTGLWFDAVDSGRWSRYVATGPTQSGKTLACFIIPTLYHLFEQGETVICGLPDMDMAGDKWREDLLPAIEQSRYARLLPKHGGGSRGGRVESIQFRNGATLKFMSGGGSDKSRAGFTARVVVVTETDGMDNVSATSRESDKITQLEARTRAFGRRKRIYLECTVSTETGRTWREYQSGTASRIVLPCPHCRAAVTPERDHLIGWKGAESLEAARRAGTFMCPACEVAWSDDERFEANVKGRLLHRDEALDKEGNVEGNAPETDTLGFRWSGVNNMFSAAGDLAADEWRASRSTDEENAEREMRQFVWCVPVIPSKQDQTPLIESDIAARIAPWPRGVVPTGSRVLTAAMDLGKYLCHWAVVAWGEGAAGHVVDYGRLEVATDDLGVEQALAIVLREFRDMVTAGWPVGEISDKSTSMSPMATWIDAGYLPDVVYTFCREQKGKFWPSLGRGTAQQHRQWYNRPLKTGSVVKHIGHGFHLNLMPAEHLYVAEVNADHWKTWVHQRLSSPKDGPSAMTLFQAPLADHLALARHLTAEVKTEEFIAGRGVVTKWESIRKQNHWLDALYNASAAGYYCGVRLPEETPPPEHRPAPPPNPGLQRKDGRPWVDVQSWQEMQSRYFGR